MGRWRLFVAAALATGCTNAQDPGLPDRARWEIEHTHHGYREYYKTEHFPERYQGFIRFTDTTGHDVTLSGDITIEPCNPK